MQTFIQVPYRVSVNTSIQRLIPNDEVYTDYAPRPDYKHLCSLPSIFEPISNIDSLTIPYVLSSYSLLKTFVDMRTVHVCAYALVIGLFQGAQEKKYNGHCYPCPNHVMLASATHYSQCCGFCRPQLHYDWSLQLQLLLTATNVVLALTPLAPLVLSSQGILPPSKAQKISRPSTMTTAHGPTSVRRLSNSNLKLFHVLVAAVGRKWK